MKKTVTVAVSLILLTVGCAKKSSDIKPVYVPAYEYNGKSCRQLKNEVLEINRELRTISGMQDDVATKDQIAMGVGLVLFWPALFLLAQGEDNKHRIAELKGKYETIKTVGKRKGCRFVQYMN